MRRCMLLAVAVALAAPAVVAQTFINVGLPDENVAPGAVVLAQVIQFTVPSGPNLTINSVTVKNTAAETPVTAAEVEFIEIRRNTETGPTLRKYTVGSGDNLGTGINIGSLSNNTFAPGTHRLYIFVKLKPGVAVGGKLQLGNQTTPTVINASTTPATNNVDYGGTNAGAATFTVTIPSAQFDTSVPAGNVYRGQRFLAGRIVVNGDNLPFETTIAQLTITNVSTTNKLTGSYLAGVEVRRASDDALLGQQTTASELAKLTTTGVVITTSSNNKVPAFSTVVLEIWVTLKVDAPTGRKLQLGPLLRLCGPGVAAAAGKDVLAGGTAPEFTVGEPTGLDPITSLDLDGGQVFSGQRFLAQRIELVDFDDDPYDVTVNSLVVQNVATADRLSESHVARIEVVRARDGALMGGKTDASGLNSGGVRVPTANNNVIADDTTEVVEIWITLGANIPHDRKLQLRTVVWHTEDTKTFGKPTAAPWLEGPEFVTGPAAGQGLETNEPVTLADRTVFQGARFLAQKLNLIDNDVDPYDVIVTSIMVRNAAPTSVLADQHVARLEVRRASDGALLGEVTDPVGLSLAGVRVTTPQNNVIPDDGRVELEIWITLKDTAPAGRKLKLESVVWHTEGTASFHDKVCLGPATFTTAIGSPPTGVDFSWSPESPNAGQAVTFTPAAGITDPHGNIANATFSWNFGDGATVQTKGLTAVKHTYTRGGTFSVTLTVTSEGGLSASKTRQITVKGQEPTVDFTYTPASPTVGQEVAFTAIVTDPQTPPLTPYTYAWDFGDGNTATVANPRHTYTAAGTYTVVLQVTNSRGETGRAQKTITVAEPVDVPPTVTALAASPANPEVGVEVTFTATATAPTGDPVTEWEWDFGDGSAKGTTTTGTAKHTYTASGVFTVTVRARNARGGWSGPRTLSLYVRPKGGALVGTRLLDNPARTQARIQVFLPQGATGVKIQIFDMLGRPVLSADVVGGQYTWNLSDQAGRRIADGLYFYLVTATVAGKTERSEVGRILVVR